MVGESVAAVGAVVGPSVGALLGGNAFSEFSGIEAPTLEVKLKLELSLALPLADWALVGLVDVADVGAEDGAED